MQIIADIVKWSRTLASISTILCLISERIHASTNSKSLSVQEAIEIALKENLDIRKAKYERKKVQLEYEINNFCPLLPTLTLPLYAAYPLYQGNSLRSKEGNNYFEDTNSWSLKWELKLLLDKIFDIKIKYKNYTNTKLNYTKAVSTVRKEVIKCYYELVLAQKKWEVDHTALHIATAQYKEEEKNFKLGRKSRIDYLDAQLKLKDTKISLLESEENLKIKRRVLNAMLGKPLNEFTFVQTTVSMHPIWDVVPLTDDKLVDIETVIKEKEVSIKKTELAREVFSPFSSVGITCNLFDGIYSYDSTYRRSNTSMNRKVSIGLSLDMVTLLAAPVKIRIAKIVLNKAKLELIQAKVAAENNLANKKWTYSQAIDKYKIAAEKLKIEKQKLILVKEQYRLNQIKLIDVQKEEKEVQDLEVKLIEHAVEIQKAAFDIHEMSSSFLSLRRKRSSRPRG